MARIEVKYRCGAIISFDSQSPWAAEIIAMKTCPSQKCHCPQTEVITFDSAEEEKAVPPAEMDE